MKIYGIVVLMILATSTLEAQIYKWTDSNGIVHFSDTPHPGAKKIEIEGTQTYAPPVTPSSEGNNASPPVNEGVVREYKLITVTEPKNEATIRNNQGYVPVIIEISPELKTGDLLQIIYDGEPLGKPQASMIFALNDVKRGTHTIAAQVTDEEGNILNTSAEITFYMHRPYVGMVPNTKPIKAAP